MEIGLDHPKTIFHFAVLFKENINDGWYPYQAVEKLLRLAIRR